MKLCILILGAKTAYKSKQKKQQVCEIVSFDALSIFFSPSYIFHIVRKRKQLVADVTEYIQCPYQKHTHKLAGLLSRSVVSMEAGLIISTGLVWFVIVLV